MAKRFGRNQRRRLKRELERRGNEIRLMSRALELSNRELDRYRRLAETVRELFGPEFIALEPKTVTRPAADESPFETMPASLPLSARHVLAEDSEELRVQLLKLAHLRGDVWVERFRNQVHFRYQLGDARVGYAISTTALRDLPKPVLIRRISEEVTRLLVHDMCKAKEVIS